MKNFYRYLIYKHSIFCKDKMLMSWSRFYDQIKIILKLIVNNS